MNALFCDATAASSPVILINQERSFSSRIAARMRSRLDTSRVEITNTLSKSRWTTIEQIGSRFPWPFFIVVVFWLAVIFASFGLFAPRNASVTAALFVAALGLAGAIFMILEMDQPYRGVVKILSTSLRIALEQLGRP